MSNIPPVSNGNSHHTAPNSLFAKDSNSNDVLRLVYFHLSVHDLLQLGSVNQHFYSKIYSDLHLWNSLLERNFSGLYIDSRLDAKGFLESYKHLTRVQNNMRAGIYQLRTLTGHDDVVNHILIHGDWLISSSDDYTIMIWDLETGKELKTLKGHQDWVHRTLVYGDKLISASDDETIKIWDLETGKELKTLAGHQNEIKKILMYEGKLISSSEDCTIKKWDLKTGKELQTFEGHRSLIGDILINGNQLISCSANHTIKIWDLETGKELKTLAGHQDWVNHTLVYGDKLISASDDKTIKIWDLETGKVLQTLTGDQKAVDNILMHGNHLISSSSDFTIKIWDLETGKVMKTFAGHQGLICNILIYGNQLISCSADKTIKIWDLESGQVLQTLEDQWTINNILMHNGKLISTSTECTIKIRDFAVSSLRPPTQVPEENLPVLENLLAQLGITAEECSEKLNCTPDFLQKVGILSIADVKALCLSLPGIQHLEIAAEEATEDNNLLQTQAFAKKDSVTNELQNLLRGVHQRLKETENCTVLLYEGNNPWTLLQEKLNGCLAALEMQCQTRRALLKKFNPENYVKVVEEVNALINAFETVEHAHQITLLRTYVTQWGLLKAWDTLHLQDINSLAKLLQRPHLAPIDFFAMGE